MGKGVQGLKHAAKVQELSVRIAECRGSGIGVKAWCREHGIALKTYYNGERQIVKEATQQYALAAPAPAGMLGVCEKGKYHLYKYAITGPLT